MFQDRDPYRPYSLETVSTPPPEQQSDWGGLAVAGLSVALIAVTLLFVGSRGPSSANASTWKVYEAQVQPITPKLRY